MRRLDNNLSTNRGVKLLKTFKVKNTKNDSCFKIVL